MTATKSQDEIPNWVAERARCNLAGMFAALVEHIKKDVKEINRLPSARRQDHEFDTGTVPGFGNSSFTVFWRRGSNPNHTSSDRVLFEMNTTSMSFQRPHEEKIAIVPKWNHDETKCELYIGDEKYEPWQISQMALCEFFFGTIGDR